MITRNIKTRLTAYLVLITTFISSMYVHAQQLPSSYMYIGDNTRLTLHTANIYIENLNASPNNSKTEFGGGKSQVYLTGDTIEIEGLWSFNTVPDLYFIAMPDNITISNLITIANKQDLALPNAHLLIHPTSPNQDIIINETVKQNLKINSKLTFPDNAMLSLGAAPDIPSQTPQAVVKNTMKLELTDPGATINDDKYSVTSFILTPGRSSLGRHVTASKEDLIIFPVGDRISNFLPIGIQNTDKDAMFYVTASHYLYDWDTTFMSAEEKADPIIEPRQDFVKNNWIIKNDQPNDVPMYAEISFQHCNSIETGTENYNEQRTIISRYAGAKPNKLTRNYDVQSGKDVSTQSYTYWENIGVGNDLITQNIIADPEGAYTHKAFITDFSNQYPIYIKAGLAEDSMPMGGKMRVPNWILPNGGKHEPTSSFPDRITFDIPKSNEYRISGYDLYYTLDRDLAYSGFRAASSRITKLKLSESTLPNLFSKFGFSSDNYSNQDTMYFMFVPVPANGLPQQNATVEYVSSPVVVVPPGGPWVTSLTVLGNPISLSEDEPIIILLSPYMTEKIKSGTCYIIEPISKITIFKSPLERVGNSFGVSSTVGAIHPSPGVYVVVVDLEMTDGTAERHTTKFSVQ